MAIECAEAMADAETSLGMRAIGALPIDVPGETIDRYYTYRR